MSTMQYHIPNESKGQLPSLQENAKWSQPCDKYYAPKLQMLAKIAVSLLQTVTKCSSPPPHNAVLLIFFH